MKFLRSYGLLLLSMLALACVSTLTVYGLQTLTQQADILYQNGFLQIDQLAKLDSALQRQHAIIKAIPTELDLTHQAESKSVFIGLTADITASLTDMAAPKHIQQTYTDYLTQTQEIFKLAAIFAQTQATEILTSRTHPLFAQLNEYVQEEHHAATALAQNSLQHTHSTSSTLIQIISIIALTLALCVSGIGYWLSRMENQQKELTKQLVQQVRAVLQLIAQRSEHMSQESKLMLDTTNLAHQNITATVHIVDEASMNMGTVSTAVEELAATSHQINTQAQETKNVSSSVTEDITHAQQAVIQMHQSVSSISQFVKLITDIADKTNLLALNAAIEAARAGEAGRGFAVVADEVRRLSSQTNTAAEDVVNQVTNIQKISAEVQNVIHLTSEQIGLLDEVSDRVSRSVAEQNDATANISESINQTAEHMDLARTNTEQIKAISNAVQSKSKTLQQEISAIQTDISNLTEKLNNFVHNIL